MEQAQAGPQPGVAHRERTTLAVATLLALLVLLVLARGAGTGLTVQSAAVACALLAHLALLDMSLSLYPRWVLTSDARDAWLTTGLAAIAWPGIASYATMLGASDPAEGHDVVVIGVQAVVTGGALAALWHADRLPDNRAPLGVGTAVGVAAAAAAVVGPASTPSPILVGASALLILSGIGLGVTIARRSALPAWIRIRLGVALPLLSVGCVATTLGRTTGSSLAGILALAATATVLVSSALSWAKRLVYDEIAAMTRLRQRLDDAEEGIRAGDDLAHEIRATLGGITTAAQLVHTHPDLGRDRRLELEEMMDAELARLARLTRPRATGAAGPAAPVDVDRALWPLVVRQRARGNAVHWQPSGGIALGRADDIAEIVNVLLDNADQHAAGAEVWIDVHPTAGGVEIVVSDSGPGIDPAVRCSIFERGVRRSGSRGEGIGLDSARRLATQLGGELWLADAEGPGTTFVLGLRSPVSQGVTARRRSSSQAS